MFKSNSNKYIFSLILSVCLVVPFSIDIFMSGLPAMSRYFPEANVSLAFSVALLGLALAQPVYGPLLDRFGRRPVLLAGLWIFTLASAQIVFVHSFTALIIGRFLQAIGACSAIISVLAIVRDSYKNDQLIHATSLIMAMNAISPAIAPLLGSFLTIWWGWRASFVLLFLFGCFFLLLIQFCFVETQRHKNQEALQIRKIGSNYLLLLKRQGFLTYCILSGLSYSILFSYFNLSVLFIVQQMHVGLIHYGLIVAANGIAIIVMARLTPPLARKISFPRTMQIAFWTIICGGLVMWWININSLPSVITFMLPMFLTTLGIGMVRPTASAGAMQLVEQPIAGSGSALFNLISLICGSLATTLTSQIIVHVSSFGLFIVIVGLCAIAYQQLLELPSQQPGNSKI